jgi:ethanolamine ammonia-lyase small subunit
MPNINERVGAPTLEEIAMVLVEERPGIGLGDSMRQLLDFMVYPFGQRCVDATTPFDGCVGFLDTPLKERLKHN